MTIICSIILFITWSLSFLNAIRISKELMHYINRKIQYSTARTAVNMSHYKNALFITIEMRRRMQVQIASQNFHQ